MLKVILALACYLAAATLPAPALAQEQAPRDCRQLAEVAKDIEANNGPGAFVKLTRDQTIWARGYYVGAPPPSPDPGTDDAYVWLLPDKKGALVFSTNDIACHNILMPAEAVAAMLSKGT